MSECQGMFHYSLNETQRVMIIIAKH